MRSLLPILSVLLVLAAPVRAQEAPLKIERSDSVDAPSEPAEPAEADRIFKATLYLARNDAAFRAAWAGDSEGLLPTVDRISVAAPLFGVLAVSGCTSGPDGACNLAISWRTAGPDGTFDQPRPMATWRPHPEAQEKAMLAPAGLRLALDRSDPPGSYIVEATVTDMLSGHKLVVAQSAAKTASEIGR